MSDMWLPVAIGLINIAALSGFFIYGETKIQNNILETRAEYQVKLEEQQALFDVKLEIERSVIQQEVNDNVLRILADKCRPNGRFVITAKETGESRFYTCKEERGYNT